MCYWLIAIPLAAVFGIYRQLGVIGLQAGMFIAVTI